MSCFIFTVRPGVGAFFKVVDFFSIEIPTHVHFLWIFSPKVGETLSGNSDANSPIFRLFE